MIKPSLDELEDLINLLHFNCPNDEYSVLSDCNCEEVDNCYECWYKSIFNYKTKESLKSMNDNEKREE